MDIKLDYIMWRTYPGEEPRFWVLVIQALTSEGTRGRMHRFVVYKLILIIQA